MSIWSLSDDCCYGKPSFSETLTQSLNMLSTNKQCTYQIGPQMLVLKSPPVAEAYQTESFAQLYQSLLVELPTCCVVSGMAVNYALDADGHIMLLKSVLW